MKDTKTERYEIFPDGTILNLRGTAPLTWAPDTWNYPCVNLMRLDAESGYTIPKKYRVHEIIGEAFLGPLESGQVWRHWDGDPWNNHVENLHKGTPYQNVQDQKRHGRFRPNG